jgi:hypothetical protein
LLSGGSARRVLITDEYLGLGAVTTIFDQTGAIPAITWVKIVCVKIA